MSLGSNGLERVRSLRKISMRLHGTNFCINCTYSTRLHRVSYGNETLPNAPKYYETHQNMSLGSNGVDRVCSLRKIPTRLCGTNFCTSSGCCVLSFARQPKDPESTQIVRNAPKRQFRVQWGGSGAFIAKISDATSLHKLLH